MNKTKVQQLEKKGNRENEGEFDHFLSLDWSEKTMAIARMTGRKKEPIVFERPTDLKELKLYLGGLKGKTILTIEETTTSQWLYLELRDYVDQLIICDPFRNRLLSDGPKTDKIDARKLCLLLKANMLKEVYHSSDRLYELRRLVSAYEDVVGQGVRILNQHSALERARIPKNVLEKDLKLYTAYLDKSEEIYSDTKEEFEKKFEALSGQIPKMKKQMALPGIGVIGAAKIMAYAVDGKRFRKTGKYYSYCGLVKLELVSGGRSYGRKRPRANTHLKTVYKTAAMIAIQGKNPMQEYYDYLLSKGIAHYNARQAVARYIARVSYGMLKTGQSFEPYRWRKSKEEKATAA
jgi:transposase